MEALARRRELEVFERSVVRSARSAGFSEEELGGWGARKGVIRERLLVSQACSKEAALEVD